MDHSLDLAPMWILALRADLPLLAKVPISSSNPEITSMASAMPMSRLSSSTT
jgi:hypothetical protein